MVNFLTYGLHERLRNMIKMCLNITKIVTVEKIEKVALLNGVSIYDCNQ